MTKNLLKQVGRVVDTVCAFQRTWYVSRSFMNIYNLTE